MDDQRWSFGVADGLERRLAQVVVRVDPRRLVAERLFAYPVHVAGAVVAEPIDDAPQRHRGLESVGVPDDPIDQETAVTSAGDAHAVGVDVGLVLNEVGPRHHIGIIGGARRVPNGLGVFLPVPGAAARVGEIDHVVVGSQVVELVHEHIAVLASRSAVYLEDRRVFFRWVEVGRLQNPALQVVACRPLEPYFLDLA